MTHNYATHRPKLAPRRNRYALTAQETAHVERVQRARTGFSDRGLWENRDRLAAAVRAALGGRP